MAALILFQQSAGGVLAYNFGAKGLINNVNRLQNQASNAAARRQGQLQNIIHRADILIANRLATLNTLSTRLQHDIKLSASEKSSLASDIQTAITGLTMLKATIDADTDITKARNDEKQIITGYYIYAMFEPKIRLLIVLNNLQTVSANLQALVPQIQNLITSFQSQGKDVSSLQSLLSDVSSQLQTMNTTLTSDSAALQSVSVSTTSPQATFTRIHQDIAQIVRSGFAKIRSDFAQMRPLFHQLIFNKASELTSPTGIQSPTATGALTATPTP